MKKLTTLQECHSCGARFTIEYCENGAYDYLDHPCECESDFSPAYGEPSISEWLDSLTH